MITIQITTFDYLKSKIWPLFCEWKNEEFLESGQYAYTTEGKQRHCKLSICAIVHLFKKFEMTDSDDAFHHKHFIHTSVNPLTRNKLEAEEPEQSHIFKRYLLHSIQVKDQSTQTYVQGMIWHKSSFKSLTLNILKIPTN